MKINFTMEEYFDEIALMEQQYGLEEELYPWIYMLLKQAESEKIGENISIRIVANGVKLNDNNGREQLKGCVGFPDIVILGKEFNQNSENNNQHIYGCIEAKVVNSRLRDIKSGEISVIQGEELKYKKLEGVNYHYVQEKKDKWILCNTGNVKKPRAHEEIKVDLKKCDNTYIVIENNAYQILKMEEELITAEGQLLGELLWFGKVLYTNGLVWKHLEVTACKGDRNRKLKGREARNYLRELIYNSINTDKNNLNRSELCKWCKVVANKKVNITCEIISDLTTSYKEYCKNSFNVDSSEWEKLMYNLKQINWHY